MKSLGRSLIVSIGALTTIKLNHKRDNLKMTKTILTGVAALFLLMGSIDGVLAQAGVAELLKICKTAGAGVAVGTQFTFDFTINSQPGVPVQPMTIPAGPANIGGYCYYAPGPYGQGQFIGGQTVTVTERPAHGVLVSNIWSSVPGGTTYDLLGRTATITLGSGGVSELSFTNTAFDPTLLKICKIAGPGVRVGEKFTFHVTIIPSQRGLTIQPVTIAAGPASDGGNCQFVHGPYTPNQDGIGTFKLGQTVDVHESAVSGVTVTDITSSTGSLDRVDLVSRTARMTLTVQGDYEFNELTFTNARSRE